ncbi:cytochrome P450 [Aspergillus stella-maris]|uniref:cytochrome P450 n=1 Tax=Aspergillus stella-maris TaxID=1810926 RepID=UPI003CCCB81F
MASIATIVLFGIALAAVQLLRTRYNALRHIPGPLLATVSNIWKVRAVYREKIHLASIDVHRKYGPVVRIGPHHVSLSSPEAFSTVHACRTAFPKSRFYEVGAPTFRGTRVENLFSIRHVHYHALLRKNIGSLYTKAAVRLFEPQISNCVEMFICQMRNNTGRPLDMSLWLHLYAYDSLGAVNVSRGLGFLNSGSDVGGMIKSADRILYMVGLLTQAPSLHYLFGILRSLVPAERVEPILLVVFNVVDERLKSREKKTDILDRFLALHESDPDKVSVGELTAAIFINLMAGHDVLATTLRAVWYYLAQDPHIMRKLHAEIAAARIQEHLNDSDDAHLSYEKAASLPYLDAVLHETFRMHPPTGTILERKVPDQGTTIDGYKLPAGTIVGVNAWALHRDPSVFGADVDAFRPERWIKSSPQQRMEMKKFLFTFGAGAHTCIGQHIAMIQITNVVAEFFYRFSISLANPEKAWKVTGSWVTKQTDMDMIVTPL